MLPIADRSQRTCRSVVDDLERAESIDEPAVVLLAREPRARAHVNLLIDARLHRPEEEGLIR